MEYDTEPMKSGFSLLAPSSMLNDRVCPRASHHDQRTHDTRTGEEDRDAWSNSP